MLVAYRVLGGEEGYARVMTDPWYCTCGICGTDGTLVVSLSTDSSMLEVNLTIYAYEIRPAWSWEEIDYWL
jgi:hypothetical protein